MEDVDIGGRQTLHLECSGDGSPTVLLESGAEGERAISPSGVLRPTTHILIRDAAYESLPKRERADLHERTR